MSPSAGERLGQAEQLLLSDSKRLFLAPGTAPTCPRACPRRLRKVPQPPTLPSTRRFMNNPGLSGSRGGGEVRVLRRNDLRDSFPPVR